jgi:hypothetical protein
MNILGNNSLSEQPSSNEVMAMALGEIHDILLEPMQGKLTEEQDAVLALIGATFKIIAEKATALENMEQDELNNPKKDNFYRN